MPSLQQIGICSDVPHAAAQRPVRFIHLCRDPLFLPYRCPPVAVKLQPTLSFLNKQSAERLHKMVAKMIYSLNVPFSSVEVEHLRNLLEVLFRCPLPPCIPFSHLQALAPGCGVPTRAQVSGKLLDDLYSEERLKLRDQLQGTYQTLSVDSWTGPSNRPTLGTAIGRHFLGLLDTIGVAHDAQQIRVRHQCAT